MAKWFFGGQARKKEAKFELFGLQEANLATLLLGIKNTGGKCIGLHTQRPIFTQVLRKKEIEFLLKKTISYSIFSTLFIAVGYIAAQA